MAVKPIAQTNGVSRAEVGCDACARTEVVPCGYVRGATKNETSPNESQARAKVMAMGWTYVKGKLRCPLCEAKRKANPEKPKEVEQMKAPNVTQIRHPSPKQKREIIGILEDVYDDDSKRYRGHETDKTVAETIGGGVMPGWVAEIREDMFGPAGGNEEIEKLSAEINKWAEEMNREQSEAAARFISRVNRDRMEFEKRIEAIKKAVGPRAASA